MAEDKLVPFKSPFATIYRGAGRGFTPGSLTLVPQSHVTDLSAHDDAHAARLDAAKKFAEAKVLEDQATAETPPAATSKNK